MPDMQPGALPWSHRSFNRSQTDDPRDAFLKQLDMDPGNLHLFKADELDGDAMTVAFAGCKGVFHIGTPVPKYERVDPQAIGVTDM
uniref:Uncharacterized protein n=1 Tax=Oryza glaberrima TaxID=4538 RepID=I1QRY6_ORYGL